MAARFASLKREAFERILKEKDVLNTRKECRFVRILFQNTECCAARTLHWKAGESVEVLTRTCAEVFAINDPQHYCLFWRNGGEMHPVPLHTQPHELAAPTLSYLRKDHDFSKMRRLTRGGAVDLEESACEE